MKCHAVLTFLTFISTLSQCHSQTASPSDCPEPWKTFGDSCYYVIDTEITWFEADQHCTFLLPGTYKSHLVAVDSPPEQLFLTNLLSNDPGYRSRNYWTSGNIIDRRVGWKWSSTGERKTYLNWAPGEPNGSGNCVQIWGEFGYGWDDTDCESEVNFICEAVKSDVLAAYSL